ncbi:gremlin-1-like [Strongylocentrotus purpuratus]|uniref:CTCK domain-containing protein n=1 Tax=Strongylocentrotus purpuratus TaxID=7668 RepID=A0A7M7NYP1_STRPU|nr:gremlin-1-like [Strongylocentrotus purpuratus]|eukprot:XP_011662344.1 PREDICTED: gremlin-1-like [Strongylocentrotus purpuratus]
MIAAVLWISSLLACALMTSSVPHADVASRVFHHRVSSQGSNDLPTDTQKRHDQDHVTMSPQSDSSDTHYGAHLIDRTVLFPHDTTWCVARPISQVIESPGCTARTIPNKMCAGQCYSFTVPKIFPHDIRSQFKSCDCCQPSRVTWVTIPLSCNAVDGDTVLHKHVEVVEECECKPCSFYTSTSSWSTESTTTNDTEYSDEQSSYVESPSAP